MMWDVACGVILAQAAWAVSKILFNFTVALCYIKATKNQQPPK